MKNGFISVLGLISLFASSSALAATVSCVTEDGNVNFYILKKQVAVNIEGEPSFVEEFSQIEFSISKRNSIRVSSSDGKFSLDTTYDSETAAYEGTLSLESSRGTFIQTPVSCYRVN